MLLQNKETVKEKLLKNHYPLKNMHLAIIVDLCLPYNAILRI